MMKMKKETTLGQPASSLSDYVERVLDANDIKYERLDDSDYKVELQGSPVDIDILVQCNGERDFICIFAVPEYKVPLDKISSVLHEINRLNVENPGQCLRVDETDGILSSASLINTEGGISDGRIFMASLCQCFYMVNENIKGILECIYGKGKMEDILLNQMSKDGQYSC